jgi:crotonobetainyl-CoA:carnitine CoA-transferase CaiB-like acyl-CoA transferase
MTTAGSLDDAGPLRGLRVLDVTEEPDALLASSFLADLGADVVMLETAPLGHRARRLGPMKGSVSLLWKVTGRNKRSVRWDRGRLSVGWLDELLARADVLIGEPAFCLPGEQGSSLPELSHRHQHLVVLSTSPFGAAGPLSGRRC